MKSLDKLSRLNGYTALKFYSLSRTVNTHADSWPEMKIFTPSLQSLGGEFYQGWELDLSHEIKINEILTLHKICSFIQQHFADTTICQALFKP